jgi:hypothetical protein
MFNDAPKVANLRKEFPDLYNGKVDFGSPQELKP